MIHQEQFIFESGDNVYLTSDLHYGHSNIINFCKRPFSSVEEMDQKLIENWNNTVQSTDYIFVLGDFCFKGSQYWDNILNQLNGHKFLIFGNHDEKHRRDGAMLKFDWVGSQCKITVAGHDVYLNHYPFLCYGGTYRDPEHIVINAHGHTHLSERDLSGKDIQRLQYCFPTQYDVGVDANNFTPISFNQMYEKVQNQIQLNKNQYQLILESISQ